MRCAIFLCLLAAAAAKEHWLLGDSPDHQCPASNDIYPKQDMMRSCYSRECNMKVPTYACSSAGCCHRGVCQKDGTCKDELNSVWMWVMIGSGLVVFAFLVVQCGPWKNRHEDASKEIESFEDRLKRDHPESVQLEDSHPEFKKPLLNIVGYEQA